MYVFSSFTEIIWQSFSNRSRRFPSKFVANFQGPVQHKNMELKKKMTLIQQRNSYCDGTEDVWTRCCQQDWQNPPKRANIFALDNQKFRQYELHAARYTALTNSAPKGELISVGLNTCWLHGLESHSTQRFSRQKLLKGNVQKNHVQIFISHSFGTKRRLEEEGRGAFTQHSPPHRDVSRDRIAAGHQSGRNWATEMFTIKLK
jgi:hypothetical protein